MTGVEETVCATPVEPDGAHGQPARVHEVSHKIAGLVKQPVSPLKEVKIESAS
jgi:hypothetical protein